MSDADASPASSSADGSDASALDTGGSRRLRAVLVLALVPWSVQVFARGDVTFLFAWGLLNTNPVNVTTLSEFLFRYTQGLPDYILVWPIGVGCYLVAVGSAVLGRVRGYEDGRLTAAALVLAGVTQLELARGFSVQPGRVAWPVGTVALWAVAGYVYYVHATRRDAGDGDQ